MTGFGRARAAWLIGAAFVLLAFAPRWADDYSLSVYRDALIFGLLALSLDFLWGKTGLMSFGHAAFFGLGAYVVAIAGRLLAGDANAAPIALMAAIALAALLAAFVGYFLLYGGVRGPYFTIVTLAISLVAEHIAIGWSQVTGGDSGLIGAPPPGLQLFSQSFAVTDPAGQYLLALAVAAGALACLWAACRGHFGLVLAAIQDNELRARTLGYNTSLVLVVVFVVSAALASLAGGLYAMVSGFVAPDLVAPLLSTEIVVWVAIGGRGTFVGPMIGAFLIIRLQEQASSVSPHLWPLMIGAFFVAMVFAFPDGVAPMIGKAWNGARRWLPRASAS